MSGINLTGTNETDRIIQRDLEARNKQIEEIAKNNDLLTAAQNQSNVQTRKSVEDIDKNGDGVLTESEFKAQFGQNYQSVFNSYNNLQTQKNGVTTKTETSEDGTKTSKTYDASGKLIYSVVTTPDGTETVQKYEADGKTLSSRSTKQPNGTSVSEEYSNGKLVKKTTVTKDGTKVVTNGKGQILEMYYPKDHMTITFNGGKIEIRQGDRVIYQASTNDSEHDSNITFNRNDQYSGNANNTAFPSVVQEDGYTYIKIPEGLERALHGGSNGRDTDHTSGLMFIINKDGVADSVCNYDNGRLTRRTFCETGNYRNYASDLTWSEDYDKNGRLISKQRYNRNTEPIRYDSRDAGYWTSSVNLLSREENSVTERTLYDNNGRVKAYEVCDGYHSKIYSNESRSRLIGEIIYYPDGNVKQETKYNSDGSVEITEYNQKGNKVKQSYTGSDRTEVSTFDANGKIASKNVKYNDGREISYTYKNGVIDSETETNAKGQVVSQSSYENGKARQSVETEYYQNNSNAKASESFYGSNGQLTRQVEYYPEGQIKSETKYDESGYSQTSNYDENGKITSQVNNYGGMQEVTTYDSLGRIASQSSNYRGMSSSSVYNNGHIASTSETGYDADGSTVTQEREFNRYGQAYSESTYRNGELEQTVETEYDEDFNTIKSSQTVYDAQGNVSKKYYRLEEILQKLFPGIRNLASLLLDICRYNGISSYSALYEFNEATGKIEGLIMPSIKIVDGYAYIGNDTQESETVSDSNVNKSEAVQNSQPQASDGVERTYYPNGNIESETKEENGVKTITLYDEKGNKKSVTEKNKFGKDVQITNYDEKGNVKDRTVNTYDPQFPTIKTSQEVYDADDNLISGSYSLSTILSKMYPGIKNAASLLLDICRYNDIHSYSGIYKYDEATGTVEGLSMPEISVFGGYGYLR